jgi:hypothetical protein
VAIGGLMYRLQCIVDGAALDSDELQQQLELMAADARARLAGGAPQAGVFGLLTVLFNPKHARLFRELQSNSVESIDRALFCVAIDLDTSPTTLDATMRALHADNYRNRDHRRSLQIVVAGNGRAAITVHPHAGIGGTYMARFASELHKACARLQAAPLHIARPAGPARYQHLPLELSQKSWAELQKSVANVGRRLYPANEPSVIRYEGFGSDAFRDRGISADGAFHAALHLAYLRCFGEVPYTSNFINLRNVRHGDVWKYTSTTESLRRFAQAPSAEALRLASDAHRALVKINKAGDDEVYQTTMALFRLISEGHVPFAAFPALMMMMSLFISNFGKRFLGSDLWVSNIPPLPGVEMTARAAVRLAYLDKKGYGGHYMIFPGHVTVCLVNALKDKNVTDRDARFFQTLGDCLREVVDLAASEPARKSTAAAAQAALV